MSESTHGEGAEDEPTPDVGYGSPETAPEGTDESTESGLQGPEDVRLAGTDDEPSGASPGNVGGGRLS